MLKIIYGVRDNSTVCELIFPTKDNIGISNFINQSVIKNDFSEQIVGNSFYSIKYVSNYYVFSKTCLVYDSGKRVSYRAYIIALEEHETSYSAFDEIANLESQYTDNDEILQDAHPKKINTKNDIFQNTNITVYYNTLKELKKFFLINKLFKKYDTIYFINESHKTKPESDPINSLREAGSVVLISTLISDNNENGYGSNEKRSNSFTPFEFRIGVIIAFLVGLIVMYLPNISIFKANISDDYNNYVNEIEKLSDENRNLKKRLEDTVMILQKSSTKMKNKLDSIKTIVNNIETKVGEGSTTIKPKPQPDEELIKDMQIFLQTGCKNMKISEIQAKIKKEDPNFKYKNYVSFSNFLILVKRKQINKDSLEVYVINNQNSFNDTDEYVKFVKYLKSRDNQFLTNKNKSLRNIDDRTFRDIETHFDFNQ